MTSSYTGFKTTLLSSPIDIAWEVVDSFYLISSGVYKPTDCSGTTINTLNHEMQAVGFGVLNGLEYIIVRN